MATVQTAILKASITLLNTSLQHLGNMYEIKITRTEAMAASNIQHSYIVQKKY